MPLYAKIGKILRNNKKFILSKKKWQSHFPRNFVFICGIIAGNDYGKAQTLKAIR